jgi:DNA-binding IclR family transcriptional regulator
MQVTANAPPKWHAPDPGGEGRTDLSSARPCDKWDSPAPGDSPLLRAVGETSGPSAAYDDTMTRTEEIIDSIDDRLRELHEEIRTLTAARAALDGRDAPATRRRQRKSTRPVSSDKDGAAPPAAESAGQVVSVASSESSPPPPQEPRVRATPRRPRARRSVDVVAAGRLEVLLSEHDGMTTSALAERANANRDQILTALRELEAAGRVRRSGQRRSTRWHAITDEERIQKRAAELAARSKTAG